MPLTISIESEIQFSLLIYIIAILTYLLLNKYIFLKFSIHKWQQNLNQIFTADIAFLTCFEKFYIFNSLTTSKLKILHVPNRVILYSGLQNGKKINNKMLIKNGFPHQITRNDKFEYHYFGKLIFALILHLNV